MHARTRQTADPFHHHRCGHVCGRKGRELFAAVTDWDLTRAFVAEYISSLPADWPTERLDGVACQEAQARSMISPISGIECSPVMLQRGAWIKTSSASLELVSSI